MIKRYPHYHLWSALCCKTALEMPKLCKAACHIVGFNFVTISVLLKGKQVVL